MPDSLSWFLTAVGGALLIPLFRSGDYLECNPQPLSIWYDGVIAMFWTFVLIYHVSSLLSTMPNFASCLLIMIFPSVVLFMMVWTVMGTIWLLQNMIVGNNCLSIPNLIFAILFLLICYFIIFALIASIIQGVQTRDKEMKEVAEVNKKLTLIYTNKEEAKKFDFAKFVKKHLNVLKTMPLIDLEKEIINDYFTTKVYNKTADSACIVCLNEFNAGDNKSNIGCKHEFHLDCIVGWYRSKPTCPYCREPFRENLLFEYQRKLTVNGEENL